MYSYIDSAAVGPYYDICCDLGYPQCDIVKYPDGEWAVIFYENAPLVPSMTQYRVISSGIRHKEISHSLVSKLILESDPMRQRLWERERLKTKQIESDHKAREEHRDATLNEAVAVMTKNDDLMQRVAKNGMGEVDLSAIAQNIDPAKLSKRMTHAK